MKIEYIIDDSIRDYSATGNRPENSFTPIHPPVHPTPTRRTSQTRVAAGALVHLALAGHHVHLKREAWGVKTLVKICGDSWIKKGNYYGET
jgi:hypothetical protein